MANPNPSLITDPVWSLWINRPETSWRLSGIYANKSGYHNTVNANVSSWPGNYSVLFNLDLSGVRTKARAIDYTMSDVHMRKYTGRLVSAADRNDPRMYGIREFYGTVDNINVTGRIRDNDLGPYRSSSSDLSHLWHIHISFWATYVNDYRATTGLLSVLKGKDLEEWLGDAWMAKRDIVFKDDKGEMVGFIQRLLNRLGFDTVPPGGKESWRFDLVYGNGTHAAVAKSRKEWGANPDMDNPRVTGWHLYRMILELIKKEAPSVAISENDIKKIVADYIENNKDKLRGAKGDPGKPGKTPTEFEVNLQVLGAKYE